MMMMMTRACILFCSVLFYYLLAGSSRELDNSVASANNNSSKKLALLELRSTREREEGNLSMGGICVKLNGASKLHKSYAGPIVAHYDLACYYC